MSDEEEIPSAEVSAKPVTQVRRISNPRPKKTVRAPKTAEPASGDPSSEEAQPPSPSPEPASEPQAEAAPVSVDASSSSDDASDEAWADEEPSVAGGQSASAHDAKRKRRRRKGKGPHGQGQGAEEVHALSSAPAETAAEGPAPASETVSPKIQQPSRPRLDPEQLAKKAWKIFLAEVSEEGVALIGDQDARELSRRCFRLAEIFLEERNRRR